MSRPTPYWTRLPGPTPLVLPTSLYDEVTTQPGWHRADPVGRGVYFFHEDGRKIDPADYTAQYLADIPEPR